MLERPITSQRLTQAIVLADKEASMVRRTVLERYLIPFIVGIGIFWTTNAQAANEIRCTELGNNCIASEPLNTNVFVQDINAYWNPADTTTKEMTLTGGSGACIGEVGFDTRHQVDTSGEMFSALPNLSPSIKFLLRTVNDGGNLLGHVFPASAPTARVAFRWYVYFSPTFQLTGGSCLNSGKLFEMGETSIPLVWTSNGVHTMYGWAGWNPNPGLDCCVRGPGPSGGAIPYDEATMNGKWWRFEIVVRNNLPTGSVTIIQTWRKNVTNNLPEELVLDTSIPTAQAAGNQWNTVQATTLKPLKRMEQFAVTIWRNGTCGGYFGVTHMLAAAWDTDAGQRIGPAVEIEGSAVPPPKNLIVK